jgi:hypothetical protein
MARYDISRFIKFNELTPKQKRELRKRFQRRRDALEEALKVVSRSLKELASVKPKKTSKKSRKVAKK